MIDSRRLRRALLGISLVACSSVWVAPAAAGNLCLHSEVDGGWHFVLKKARFADGASGAINGFAMPDSAEGAMVPISGGYASNLGGFVAGITRYGLSVASNGAAGGSYETTFHQIHLREGQTGTDRVWRRTSAGIADVGQGSAEIVDCKTVPPLP